MTLNTESEIERRLTALRSLPILRENGWLPTITCQWLSNGVKIISISIHTGRHYNKVMSVSRDSTDAQEAIDKAFDYVTAELEELKAHAEEEQRRAEKGEPPHVHLRRLQ